MQARKDKQVNDMVEKEKIYPLIVDESENIAYISDPETYEVIYLNQAMRETLDLALGEDYKGRYCYDLFQNRKTPCPFCTNDRITKERFYTWKHYNEKLGKYFKLRDKLVEIDGKDYRLEICVDITDSEVHNKDLERQLSAEETVVQCIHALSGNEDMDVAIHSLLEIIGGFYRAEHAFIYECNYSENTVSNTYEWHRKDLMSRKEKLQDIPMEYVAQWKEHFEEEEAVCFPKYCEEGEARLPEILQGLGVRRHMAAPIWEETSEKYGGEKKIAGFIGVDNPTKDIEQVSLLHSVAFFVSNDIYKRRMIYKLKDLSHVDALTGLGNRNSYLEKIEDLKAAHLKSLGVVFVDINGLKYANDHFGHPYGDEMIRSVAQGIRRYFPEYSYRIGGDEFIALYIDGTKEEFEERLDGLRDYAEDECICDFSMGVNFGRGNVNIEEQIGYSDSMMYVEKQVYYGSVLDGRRLQHKALARKLVRDIEAGRFEIYLQPKINLETGAMVGAEALMRREGEDGEILLPDKFISLYETEGVIQYLDCYAFEEVCKLLQEWIKSGGTPVPVSVNFSRLSLMGSRVVNRLAEIRERYEVPPELLVIEVTESVSQMEPRALKGLMEDFEKYKFVVSLDDYGYQYSNLAILINMNFVELKLDKSLVDDLKSNPKARIVVENSIDMCRRLNQVISTAEGIENEDQLNILKEFHCDVGQGYFFSEPLPREVFLEKFGGHHVF
ncbi:diguanylate cyclase (GGDEF)-like protein [Faecalicatena orotica]|uniref:Diguanylate cyclase (GGDEF)-like protein n=2 Tax=Faecalicatena orotica TaxID=1544 RepID=A0A2Y9C9Q5_9FIRM|nr:diguanylate cyclase (GGDEF)-like protein [Faecalicatena orotica]SSA54668.1 diguanylate cyclase (GGDEF) domain-containing protein [Faecalicatena orotica]